MEKHALHHLMLSHLSLHLSWRLGGSIVFVFLCVLCDCAKPPFRDCGKNALAICAAVAAPEQSAESVPFQRDEPGLPPTQNVVSVALAERPASQFGGLYAKDANFVQNVNLMQHFPYGL